MRVVDRTAADPRTVADRHTEVDHRPAEVVRTEVVEHTTADHRTAVADTGKEEHRRTPVEQPQD